MSTRPSRFLTPEEYIEIERKAEYRSEYFVGEMFAMSGASREHNLIKQRLSFLLMQQLEGRGCELYTSDMRVAISATGLYTYPDLVVIYGEPQFIDKDV